MIKKLEEKLGPDRKEKEETHALLVGTYSGASMLKICEEHLQELQELAETFGVRAAGKLPCASRRVDAATYLQSGKVSDVSEALQHLNANLIIFDEEISPAQQRNLENILKVPVMDRTELILEIFAQRAQTKEALIQIELARTKYQLPRLKRMWSHFSRQRARGGYLKGEGEKQIEIDRRILKRKLEKLNEELKDVKRYRETQRSLRTRSRIPTFAIIGYTNVGKSTLLNALTDAKVLVEDKLFATLDPTTRKFMLPNNQEILLTDTVGFIRKLPHALVAAFRSTLESALHDDVLLHLIDISHPMAEEHGETTRQLLKELNAQENSIITILNKSDLCRDNAMINRIRLRYPNTVVISALKKTGFDELLYKMVEQLKGLRQFVKLRIPQEQYSLVAAIKREGKVLFEEYQENDILIRAEVPVFMLNRLSDYQVG